MLRQSLSVIVLLVLLIAVADISYAAPMPVESNVSADTEGTRIDKRVLIGLVIGIFLVVASITALCIAGSPSLCRRLCCARGPAPGGFEGKDNGDNQKANVTVSMSVCDSPAIAVSSITGSASPPFAQVAVPSPSVAVPSVVHCQSDGA